MYYDLNKKDKKIARLAIDKGIEAKYKEGIEKMETVITEWRNRKLNAQDAYLKLYDTLQKHDKEITERYNDLGGSKYLFTVAAILHQGYISEEDVKEFSDEAKEQMNQWVAFWKRNRKANL